MKFVLMSGLLTVFATAQASAADARAVEATRTIVGVLMDANCSAIAGSGRHAEPAVRTASTKPKAAKEGTRARSVKASSDEDRYEGCKATSTSTEFAIHTDGRLYLLDTAGNDMVRQQMRNESFRSSLSTESGEARWLTLMVEGRASGDTLEVVSLRR